jgi:hypothetical protein
VTGPIDAELGRAREDLGASLALIDAGFRAQAVTSAYFAAFHAASAALLSLGESRSKHSGVISAFGELVVRDGGFDRPTAKVLSGLFDDRNEADYDLGVVSSEEARESLADARRFVEAVDDWIASRQSPA